MIKISKPLLSNILQNQFKLNSTQTKQAIRYFTNFNNNNNNNNNKYNNNLSIINYNGNNSNNIRGISFFKITPTSLNNSIRQYSSKKNEYEYSLEDEEKETKEKKQEEVKTQEEQEFDEEMERDKKKREQTNIIYGIFSVLFISTATLAIYNLVQDFKNSSTNPLGMPTYDAVLLLQDIYFGDLKPAMEKGNPDFDALTKKNYFFDESGIRNHSSGSTTTLIVPIKQKKSRHDLGTINIDFVKEGKYISIENFYINAINGYHYPLEAPDNKIDTTLERYTGKYSLEELLGDPNLGISTNY